MKLRQDQVYFTGESQEAVGMISTAVSVNRSGRSGLDSMAALAPSSTRTVDRALGLLAEICAEGSLSLSEVARRADLPASTALRLLRTLEQADFLSRNAAGLFEAGTRLIQLGATAFGRQSLVAFTEPSLQRLVAATGESAYVSQPGAGDSALYLGMVEGTYAIRHTSWVGRTVPLAGTAVGLALRGQVPPAGFVWLRSAVESDVTAIAAPIRRPGGIAGAISLVGPTYRIDEPALETFGRLLAEEAAIVGAHFSLPATPAPTRRPESS